MTDEQMLQIIREHLEQNEKVSWVEVGKKIGKSPEAARSFWRRNGDDNTVADNVVSPNERILESNSEDINTLPELLAFMEIDEEEWVVLDFEVAKKTTKVISEFEQDMEWDEGRISGTKVRGPERIVPVVHIKARIVRRKPILLEIPVQPIKVGKPYVPAKRVGSLNKVTVTLFGSDQQVGFFRKDSGELETSHDDEALDVFEQVAADLQPDIIMLNGDLLDLPTFSKYTTLPGQQGLTQSTIYRGHYHLATLRSLCPKSQIIVGMGNHDERIFKAVEVNLSGLVGVHKVTDHLRLPVYHPANLMDFDGLGVEWGDRYPDDLYWLTEHIQIIHGMKHGGGQSGRTVSAMLKDEEVTTIQGHSHRMEMAVQTSYGYHGMTQRMAVSLPCLCKPSTPGGGLRPNWQQGLVITETLASTQLPAIRFVPIVGGTLVQGGQEFIGNPDLQAMRDSLNWQAL